LGYARNWVWFPAGISNGLGGGLRGGAAFGLEPFDLVRDAVEGELGEIDAALEERGEFAAVS